MSTSVEQIKSRLDIVEVISEYVPLKRAGINYAAKCPFHNEKAPSFYVSPQRQTFKCFGCGEGGDIFTFVQKYEGLEFKEALELLAKKAGVELPKYKPEEASQRQKLLAICEQATDFFQQQLQISVVAKQYLQKRLLNESTIKSFRLGYAPAEYQSLMSYLTKQNFSTQDLVTAGLVKLGQHSDYYDHFRNRLIFPIRNLHGQVVGFGGRVLDDNDQPAAPALQQGGPKYLNSPQTPIYNKSQILFNLDQAKEGIKKAGYAILVEGYMDCLAVHQAGMQNVVAVSGTALTNDQLKILRRFTSKLMIALDADLAGDAASRRGLDLAWQYEFELKRVVLPPGVKDPDECIKQDAGLWKEALKTAQPIMEHYFNKAVQGLDLQTVNGKKAAAKVILPIIAQLTDPIEQTHYLQQLGRLLNVDEVALRQVLPSAKTTTVKMESNNNYHSIKLNQVRAISERLLNLIWRQPTVLDSLPIINDEDWSGDDLRDIYKLTVSFYNTNRHLELNEFLSQLANQPANLTPLADSLAFACEQPSDQTPEEITAESLSHLKWLRIHNLNNQLQQLQIQMRQAEGAGDQERLHQLAEAFRSISQQLAELQKS